MQIETGADCPWTAARWSAGPDGSVLTLSASLAASGREDYVLRRIEALRPLLAACDALGAEGEAWLSLEDHAVLPGLSFCDRADGALIPDPDFLLSRGYEALRAAPVVPWAKRIRVAGWRGSSTGRMEEAGHWRRLQRVRLAEIAGTRPDLFDAGLSSVVQIEEHAPAIHALGLLREPVPAAEWSRWRVQIDVDGNANAWGGFFARLLTGSPVLKVASPLGFRQWYYHRLVPWVHYVPVAADLSDLIERAEWLLTHDAAARAIGEAGRAVALAATYEAELRVGALTVRRGLSRG